MGSGQVSQRMASNYVGQVPIKAKPTAMVLLCGDILFMF